MRPRIFLSYAREDAGWKDRLLEHLGAYRGLGLLDVWDDDRIGPGADWEAKIDEGIELADVAVLLVSSSFLNSDFIREYEVPRILARRSEGLRVIPVMVRPCPWTAVDWLAAMQHLPGNSETLSSGSAHEIDARLASTAQSIYTMCEGTVVDVQPVEARDTTAPPLLASLGEGTRKPQYVGYIARDRTRATFNQIDARFLRRAAQQPQRLARLGFGPAEATTARGSDLGVLSQLDVVVRYLEETSSIADLQDIVAGSRRFSADWYFVTTDLRAEEWDEKDPGLILWGRVGPYTLRLSCAKNGFSGLNPEDGKPIPTSTNRFLFRGEAALPMRGLIRLAAHDARERKLLGSPLFLVLTAIDPIDDDNALGV